MAQATGCACNDVKFTRRHIREFTGWSFGRVGRYLKGLVELEYVLVQRAIWGLHEYRLVYAGQGRDGSSFLMAVKSLGLDEHA